MHEMNKSAKRDETIQMKKHRNGEKIIKSRRTEKQSKISFD